MTMPNFTDGQIVSEVELDQLSTAINGLIAATSFAKYVQSTLQNVPTGGGAFTPVAFNGTPEATTSGVVASGAGNTDFTINQLGVWIVSATGSLAQGFPAGQRFMSIVNQAMTVRHGSSSGVDSGNFAVMHCSVPIRVLAPITVRIGIIQQSGVTVPTDVAFDPSRISFVRIPGG